MSARNLSSSAKILKCQDHTAAGTTEVDGDAVDMQGYDGVLLLTSFGTAASGNLVKAQGSADGSTGWTDLAGTSVTSGTTDEDVWLDLFRPGYRYVRLVALRGTSSTLESVWSFRYGAKDKPVTNSVAGTIIGELSEYAIAGTA